MFFAQDTAGVNILPEGLEMIDWMKETNDSTKHKGAQTAAVWVVYMFVSFLIIKCVLLDKSPEGLSAQMSGELPSCWSDAKAEVGTWPEV